MSDKRVLSARVSRDYRGSGDATPLWRGALDVALICRPGAMTVFFSAFASLDFRPASLAPILNQ